MVAAPAAEITWSMQKLPKGRTGTFGEFFCAIKAGRWNVSGRSELNINGKSIEGDDKDE